MRTRAPAEKKDKDSPRAKNKSDEYAYFRKLKYPIKYYENLQKILDARATKKDSIQLRKNILDHKQKNYQKEFERIRGDLDSQIIRGINKNAQRRGLKS